MGALLVSRLLHPLGMYASPNTLQFRIGRVGGISLTLVLLLACALTILSRLPWAEPDSCTKPLQYPYFCQSLYFDTVKISLDAPRSRL